MEAVAKLMNVPTSPRKMRLVAELIRGRGVSEALSILKRTPNHAARGMEKLLLSCISNWGSKNQSDPTRASLFIDTIFVDSGKVLKRIRPAPQGRANKIKKRSNHVTMVIDKRDTIIKKHKAKSIGSEVITEVSSTPSSTDNKKNTVDKQQTTNE